MYASLKDMKIKIMVELFGLTDMMQYADICGFTLARRTRPLG